jgi:nucleotide-binding universal stress UspA family protein
MFSVQTILVPVVAPETFADSRRLLEQIAWLARHFQSEVILLHAITGFDYPAGMLERGHEITQRDLRAEVVQFAEDDLARLSLPDLDGILLTRILLRGEPAGAILQTAIDRDVRLIVMPSPADPAFFNFLTGSVTAKILRDSACPIWSGAHLGEAPDREFSVEHIICSIDLTPHNRRTAAAAAELASSLGAKLTLVHITTGVEVWGPGGTHVDPDWKKTLVDIAVNEISRLQQELGTNAEVIIESGNVPELLNRVAERTNADLLVIGRTPGRSHLGDNDNGCGIIRESRIPVLSV